MKLKEAIKILTRYIDEFEYRNKYLLAFNEENLKLAIETVLEALKNSIPTKKVENKIKELKEGINNCDRYDYYSEYDCTLLVIRLLQELLEEI